MMKDLTFTGINIHSFKQMAANKQAVLNSLIFEIPLIDINIDDLISFIKYPICPITSVLSLIVKHVSYSEAFMNQMSFHEFVTTSNYVNQDYHINLLHIDDYDIDDTVDSIFNASVDLDMHFGTNIYYGIYHSFDRYIETLIGILKKKNELKLLDLIGSVNLSLCRSVAKSIVQTQELYSKRTLQFINRN